MPNTKQLTAMQELSEWLNEFDNTPIKPTYANMREKVWEKLATERQQLIDFGESCINNVGIGFELEKHFDNTFKPNK